MKSYNQAQFSCSFCYVTAILIALVSTIIPIQAAETVYVSVNGQAITTYEVKQRLNLLRAFTKSQDIKESQAVQDLINEKIQLQFAKNNGITVSDKELKQAIISVAKNANMDFDKFISALQDLKIDLKSYNKKQKATLIWKKMLYKYFLSKQTSNSIKKNKSSKYYDRFLTVVDASENKGVPRYKFYLSQLVFVVDPSVKNNKKDQKKAIDKLLSKTHNCKNLKDNIYKYQDVIFEDVGIRTSEQLPNLAIAAELAKTKVGKLATPELTHRGYESIIVCSKKRIAGALPTNIIKNDQNIKSLNKELFEKAKKNVIITYK